jgi:hypothetical protein
VFPTDGWTASKKPSVWVGDFFVFVDFTEKAPSADSITPGVGIETP